MNTFVKLDMQRLKVLLSVVTFIGPAAISACGGPPTPSAFWPSGTECQLLVPPERYAEGLTIALSDPVQPEFAPWGHNAGEQLVFRHLYETLIVTDCTGEVRPALARTWRRSDGGRQWTFEIRPDARFWDGSRVTAVDVVRSWQDALLLDTGIDSARATGTRKLQVYLSRADASPPAVLATPPFAVAIAGDGSRWPLGSGPYEVPEEARVRGGSQIEVTITPASGRKGPSIRFVSRGASDARDLLDGSVDLVVTAEASTIEYAMGRSNFSTIELPWDRTYVLVSPSRVWAKSDGRLPADISPTLARGLARDAVRGEARAAMAPFWWHSSAEDDCRRAEVGEPPLAPSPSSRGILYDVGDETARDLAQRLVALANADPATSVEAAALVSVVPGCDAAGIVAEGVSGDELGRRLREGDAFAYILSLPRRSLMPCEDVRQLFERAPWLRGGAARVDVGLVPLIDTRSYVIAHRDRLGLVLDGHGNVLVVGGKGN